MKQSSKILAVFALALVSISAPAHANYVISVGSLTLAPGGSGTLDVNINSTSVSGDNLDSFGFQFQITTLRPTLLEFNTTQPNPYSNSSYVFFGNSLNQGPPLFPLGNVSSMGAQSNTYTGGDGTVSGSVHITGTSKLLLQLSVTAATGALSPVPGDTFSIGLLSNANTFFSASGTNVPFTSTPGTVTISSVPAPASLVMFGLCVGIGSTSWLFRRRHAILRRFR